MITLCLSVLLGPITIIDITPKPPKEPTYFESWHKAKQERKPLVVFVGIPRRELTGCVTCRVEKFDEGTPLKRGIVVGVMNGERMERTNLPSDATDEDIRRATKPPESRISTPIGLAPITGIGNCGPRG